MVPVRKPYIFESSDGPITLKDLFSGNFQLVVYQYIFGPTAEESCQGSALTAANFPNSNQLAEKDTPLAVISRAPIDNITLFKKKIWSFPWVSSNSNDFNYDFMCRSMIKLHPWITTFSARNISKRQD